MYMDIDYNTLMIQARKEARINHHKYIRTEHLLLALLTVSDRQQSAVNLDCIRDAVSAMRCPTCDAEERMELSASAQRAYKLAQEAASPQPVQAHHLLVAILNSSGTVGRLLASCDIDAEAWCKQLEGEIVDGK